MKMKPAGSSCIDQFSDCLYETLEDIAKGKRCCWLGLSGARRIRMLRPRRTWFNLR
jgi:hypothetical protein